MGIDDSVNYTRDSLNYDDEYKKIQGFIDSGNFKDGFNYLSNLKKQFGPSITLQDRLVLNLLLCTLQSKSGKYQENLKLISTLEGTIQSQIMFIDFIIVKADTLWKVGKQDEALKTLEENEDKINNYKTSISEKNNKMVVDFLARESEFKNLKGIINFYLGEMQDAKKCFEESLALKEKLSIKKDVARILNNLGILYTNIGELETALEYYNRVIELLKDSPNKEILSAPYTNIGEIYQYMGQFGYAFDFYNLALDIIEHTDDKLTKATIYSLFLDLHVESNNLPEAQLYLDKLKLIDDPPGENANIHNLFILSKGFILKNSEGLIKKFSSGENFLEIANGPVKNFENTAKAIFNLNDLLLLEAKLTKNEQRLVDVQSWLNKLI